jgi:hypothetical protein
MQESLEIFSQIAWAFPVSDGAFRPFLMLRPEILQAVK